MATRFTALEDVCLFENTPQLIELHFLRLPAIRRRRSMVKFVDDDDIETRRIKLIEIDVGQ